MGRSRRASKKHPRADTAARKPASRDEVAEAYAEASRAAARLSLLGAAGFGLALAMGGVMAGGESILGPGFWLERLLLAGGLAGGVSFTFLALRANRAAAACKRLLERR